MDLDLRVQCFSEGFVRWRRFPDLVPQEWLGNYSLGVVLLRLVHVLAIRVVLSLNCGGLGHTIAEMWSMLLPLSLQWLFSCGKVSG